MLRIILAGALLLAVLSACSTRHNDGMRDLWRGVKQVQGQ